MPRCGGFASVSLSLSFYRSLALVLALALCLSLSLSISFFLSLSLSFSLGLARFVPVTVGVNVGSRATHFFSCPWRQSRWLFQKEPFCGRIGVSLACALCYVTYFWMSVFSDTSECGCLYKFSSCDAPKNAGICKMFVLGRLNILAHSGLCLPHKKIKWKYWTCNRRPVENIMHMHIRNSVLQT